jgi:hypothetical protein
VPDFTAGAAAYSNHEGEIMDDIKKFLEESPIAAAVTLPTAVIVHRQKLSPSAVSGIIERGTYEPSGEDVCELEAGGRLIARGKLVRKRGQSFFKVLEMEKGEKA